MLVLSHEAAELLEHIVSSGMEIRATEGDVQIRGNGQLTDEIRERIRDNKPELMELLRLKEHRWVQMEEWDFSLERFASQEFPGFEDLWMCGTRRDREGRTWWFVGREDVNKS